MKQKRRVKKNIWGNWCGYVGRHRVETFAVEFDAREWEKNEDDVTYDKNGFRVDNEPKSNIIDLSYLGRK